MSVAADAAAERCAAVTGVAAGDAEADRCAAVTGVAVAAAEGDRCTAVAGITGSDAWVAWQRAHRELSRALEASLAERFNLSVSALEVLGRLAAADDHRRTLTRLAHDVELSLSRISRLVDALERRELIARERCTADSRATWAVLTPAGLRLVREAQAAHRADVQRRFFDQLDADEARTLEAVFTRLIP